MSSFELITDKLAAVGGDQNKPNVWCPKCPQWRGSDAEKALSKKFADCLKGADGNGTRSANHCLAEVGLKPVSLLP